MNNSTPVFSEGSSAQGSAGAPHNAPTPPADGNGGQNSNEEPTLLQLCAKAIAKLNRVKQYQTPKGLRALRDEVNGLMDKVTERISGLEEEARGGDDLDQFACENEITLLEEKLTSLKKGPDQILARGAVLRQEEEKKRRKKGESDQQTDES
jgi:hypothetical protein